MKEQTSKEYFRSIGIIHLALLSGQIIFLLLCIYLNYDGQFGSDAGLDEVFIFMVPLFFIGGIIGSRFFSKSRLAEIKPMADLKEKLGNYLALLIVKLALLEGPSLFAIIAFLLTGNYLYAGIAGLIILLFIFQKPTRSRVANEIDLSDFERSQIENPTAIVAVTQTK